MKQNTKWIEYKTMRTYKMPSWVFRRFGDSIFLSERLKFFIRRVNQNWTGHCMMNVINKLK